MFGAQGRVNIHYICFVLVSLSVLVNLPDNKRKLIH